MEAGVAPFSFHDLRRTFADELRRSGADVATYIAIMGHSAVTGVRHYSIVTSDDKRVAIEEALKRMRNRGEN